MSTFRLSARYAKSLIDLSLEKNQLEQVTNDMRLFLSVCKNSKDYVAMLRNPIIHSDKKQKVSDQIFGSSFNTITNAFVTLIIAKSREAYLPQIAEEFIEQYNRLMNITKVTLITAAEPDSALIDTVKNLLTEKGGLQNIEFKTKINPDLIGGFQLQYEDKMYDASIQRKLEILDNDFWENNYIRQI